jgi:single stranded DNA-binding protein (ssb)
MSVAAVLNALFLTRISYPLNPTHTFSSSNFSSSATINWPPTSNPANSRLHRRIFRQDLEQSSAASGRHYHSACSAGFSISQNSLEELFSRLGQDLQSGNLSKAQSAYAPLQQEFTQLRSALSSTLPSAASGNALNVKLRSGKATRPALLFFHAPASHSSLISFFFANVLSFSFQGNLPHLRATRSGKVYFPERATRRRISPSSAAKLGASSMSVNKVILVGRLGRDPETRYTSGGQAVANFSVATDESYKDRNGERQKRTEWHKIVVWGKQAEIAQQYLKKGSLIFI